jgi:hypothetical protein
MATVLIDDTTLALSSIDRRLRRTTRAAIAAVALMGGVATLSLWRTADQRAARGERAAAARVVDRLDTEMRVIDAALSSAPVLAFAGTDRLGDTAQRAFERFAGDLIEHTTLRALAFEPAVDGDERASFEQRTGVTIRDRAAATTTSGDQWVTAPERATYAPVLWVVPAGQDTTPIVGFDLAAEPVRGAAMRAAAGSDEVAISPPLVSRPRLVTSVFVARALEVDGVTVGWVTSAITAQVFVDALARVLPDDTTVTAADGGVLLFGESRPGGTRTSVEVGARTWDVWVDAPASRHAAALAALAGTVLGTVVVGLTMRRRRLATLQRATAEWGDIAVVRRRDDRALALSQLGRRLSVARHLDDVVQAVTEYGPRASGFQVVGLATLLEGDRVVRLHGQPDGSGVPRPPSDVEVPHPAPVLDRLREGDELSFGDAGAIDRAGMLRYLVGDDVSVLELVPLRNSTRRLIGAVGFASSTRPPDPEPGYLRSVADLVAQTIERTQLFEQQAQVVLELQQHTLRPIPEVDGACIAARYLPAARALGVGGDWYGVEEIDDHESVLVVGDVVGHGITAVVDMVEISAMIAAMARSGGDLSSLPVDAAAMFDRPRQPLARMATAIVCRVDTERRHLRYVRLGHPPGVLLGPDGTARLLDEAVHPPLGVPTTRGRSAWVDYAPGSVLVLFTDGLVERRGEVLDVGLERLVRAVTGMQHCTAAEIADAVVARCAHEHAADDIALVVAHLR